MNRTAVFFAQGDPTLLIVELWDVQPLFGGMIVLVEGGAAPQVQLTRVAPGGQQAVVKRPLSLPRVSALRQLCIEQDFLTIAPQERMGVPDEARPRLTLTNGRGDSYSVEKWAGVADARFDRIYLAVKQLAGELDEKIDGGG